MQHCAVLCLAVDTWPAAIAVIVVAGVGAAAKVVSAVVRYDTPVTRAVARMIDRRR